MQNHEAWLKIASEDLAAAKALLKIELFSTVTYHCQQVAEKSLKAYLIFKKHPIIKTHDLIMLIEICIKFDKNFEKVCSEAEQLNPFSTKFRYPSEYDIPDLNDAKLAVEQAQKLMVFIVKKTSKSKAGQLDIFDFL